MGSAEEMGLEVTMKDGQWRCWHDVLWKSVPDTRGGDQKSLVTDGWQPLTVDNQWWWQGRMQLALSLGVWWLAEFISKVSLCYNTIVAMEC